MRRLGEWTVYLFGGASTLMLAIAVLMMVVPEAEAGLMANCVNARSGGTACAPGDLDGDGTNDGCTQATNSAKCDGTDNTCQCSTTASSVCACAG